MSVEKRNFWIVLTLFALLATGISVMKKLRHRDRDMRKMRIEQFSRHGCDSWKGKTDFYLPDQLPTPKNYEPLWNEARDRHAGPGGTLVVRVRVDAQGRYVEHRMLKSAHPDLRHSVEALLPLLDFVPAYHQGEAVPAWVNIPFRFPGTH